MDLIHEIDQLRIRADRPRGPEADDWRQALHDDLYEVRQLAVAYIKHRQEADKESAEAVIGLATDLQHAERENRRLAEENKRLKGET